MKKTVILVVAIVVAAAAGGCGQSKVDFKRDVTNVSNPPTTTSNEGGNGADGQTINGGHVTTGGIPHSNDTNVGGNVQGNGTSGAPGHQLPALAMADLDAIHFSSSCAQRALDEVVTPEFDLVSRDALSASFLRTCDRVIDRLPLSTARPARSQFWDSNALYRDEVFVRSVLYGQRVSASFMQEQYLNSRFGHGSLFYSLFQGEGNVFSSLQNNARKCELLNNYDRLTNVSRQIFHKLADGDTTCASLSCRQTRFNLLNRLNGEYMTAAGDVVESLDHLRVIAAHMCENTQPAQGICALEFTTELCSNVCNNRDALMALQYRISRGLQILRDENGMSPAQHALFQARQIESRGCQRQDVRVH